MLVVAASMATAAPAAVAVVPRTKPLAAPTRNDLRLMSLIFLTGDGGKQDHASVSQTKTDSRYGIKRDNRFFIFSYFFSLCVVQFVVGLSCLWKSTVGNIPLISSLEPNGKHSYRRIDDVTTILL